jgi:hypothetical protein
MKKNKLISIFTFLIIVLSSVCYISCTHNDDKSNSELLTLKFKNKSTYFSKNTDSLIDVNIYVISFEPLVIQSEQVTQIQAHIEESNEISQGLILNEDYEKLSQSGAFSRLVETSGYIFNNATQCFQYGTYITDTETGRWTFLYAVPLVQIQMNVCAPRGQMYAKTKKNEN